MMHGNEDLAYGIVFSEASQNHLKRIISKNKGSKGVSLELKKSGCAGYMYHLNLVYADFIEDWLMVNAGFHFYIKKSQLEYFKGLRVDVEREDIFGSKLVYQNPNVKASCGCGESVDLEQ